MVPLWVDMKELLRCLVCGQFPTDVDHIKTRGSGGSNDWFNVWPLCRNHHTEKHSLGLNEFIRRYQKLIPELEIRGWEFDTHRNKWFRAIRD